jgi:phosphoribosylanthranilate isomerase
MTWIKICGITNLEDARTAVDAGADALGFVFYENSPRRIDPEAARQIVAQLPSQVEKVGVFVDLSQEDLVRIVNQVKLTAMQCRLRRISGASGEQKAGADGFQRPIRMLLPVSVTWLLQDESRLKGFMADFSRMAEESRQGRPRPPSPFDTFLLDSSTPQQPGGTGRAFVWEKVAPLVEVMSQSVKVVVAGGLTPENVAEAIRVLKPWGVDVASGVEARPGKKDPEKVRSFIDTVRRLEQG